MEQIKIGQITSAVGIKGELRVYPYIEDPTHFSDLKELYVEKKVYAVKSVRYMKNLVVLAVVGVETRNDAETMKGKNLYIDKKDMWEMEEDTYLIEDLLGMTVEDQKGATVGTLVNVVQNSRQDLYEIRMEDGKQFLLPAVKEFIVEVCLEKKVMKVKLIEGLVEL